LDRKSCHRSSRHRDCRRYRSRSSYRLVRRRYVDRRWNWCGCRKIGRERSGPNANARCKRKRKPFHVKSPPTSECQRVDNLPALRVKHCTLNATPRHELRKLCLGLLWLPAFSNPCRLHSTAARRKISPLCRLGPIEGTCRQAHSFASIIRASDTVSLLFSGRQRSARLQRRRRSMAVEFGDKAMA
jgi:hypothetical protein